MRSSSDSGNQGGHPDRAQAQHPQRDGGAGPGQPSKQLYIVGIGPGGPDHMSRRAHDVLALADTVVGYTTYIDLIRPLIEGKKVVSTAMKKEVDRIGAAIDLALAGEICAIVSSGDAGVYAMAGLALEMCAKQGLAITAPWHDSTPQCDQPALSIEVVPGIPALASGAALLGAPLTHDFAAISLSDLLTPWKKIETRLDAAARADFVIVLYNPKSKKRDWQLARAQEIVLKHRDPETPVGIVTNAMRDGQSVHMFTLETLHTAPVNMLTTVFIGNTSTTTYGDFMITPRGYAKKYVLQSTK